MRSFKQLIKAGLLGLLIVILAVVPVQAASDQLKSARLSNSTLASQIDDKIGELETALGTIFGITLDANVSALFTITGTGFITVVNDLTFGDNTKVTLGTGGDADLYYDGTDTVIDLRVAGTGGLKFDSGTLYLEEIADAATDKAGYGQVWVNTATPNELWFTDDAGTDFRLGPETGTWSDVSGSRLVDTVYQNTGGNTMRAVMGIAAGSTERLNIQLEVGSANPPTLDAGKCFIEAGSAGNNQTCQLFLMIPDDWYYRVVADTGTPTVDDWLEMNEH